MGCESIAGLPLAVCCQDPFYLPGWRERMRGKVSCLREQHDGRDWVSTPQTFRSEVQCANHYTIAPPQPTLMWDSNTGRCKTLMSHHADIIRRLWKFSVNLWKSSGHLKGVPRSSRNASQNWVRKQ